MVVVDTQAVNKANIVWVKTTQIQKTDKHSVYVLYICKQNKNNDMSENEKYIGNEPESWSEDEQAYWEAWARALDDLAEGGDGGDYF